MTDLRLKINGIDFSDIVEKGSYSTDRKAVAGTKYTDLAKYNHTTVARYRGVLNFKTNTLSPQRVKEFFAEVLNAPCEVEYFSFQLKAVVTETMMPDYDAVQDAKKRESGHWAQQIKVTFTQE